MSKDELDFSNFSNSLDCELGRHQREALSRLMTSDIEHLRVS